MLGGQAGSNVKFGKSKQSQVKAGAIMCCKVRNISAPPNAGRNIPFLLGPF